VLKGQESVSQNDEQ